MKTTISIVRLAVLAVMITLVAVCMFSGNDNTALYIAAQILAMILLYTTSRLYRRWIKIDKWIAAFNALCEK